MQHAEALWQRLFYRKLSASYLIAHSQSRSRSAATSYHFWSFSMPMNLRLSKSAATPMLPLPIHGSRTMPFGSVYVRIMDRHAATGFCDGCTGNRSFPLSHGKGRKFCPCYDRIL